MKKKIAVMVVAIVLCVAAAVFAVPKISFYACEPTVYFDVEDCDKVDAKMRANPHILIHRLVVFPKRHQ